jgi:hypothetical protein
LNIVEIGGLKVAEVPVHGSLLRTEQDANDIIGALYGQEVDVVTIPLIRFVPEFFKLSNGLAGAFLQKFVTYGFRLAVVGDISEAVSASNALRDFVYESNKVGTVMFVPDMGELAARL